MKKLKTDQSSKLGDAQGIPSSSSTIMRSSLLNEVFITLHIMCYDWSIFFLQPRRRGGGSGRDIVYRKVKEDSRSPQRREGEGGIIIRDVQLESLPTARPPLPPSE